MDSKNKNIFNENKNESVSQDTSRKPYKTPVLTKYGSVAELVLANNGVGGDGGQIPPLTLT